MAMYRRCSSISAVTSVLSGAGHSMQIRALALETPGRGPQAQGRRGGHVGCKDAMTKAMAKDIRSKLAERGMTPSVSVGT